MQCLLPVELEHPSVHDPSPLLVSDVLLYFKNLVAVWFLNCCSLTASHSGVTLLPCILVSPRLTWCFCVCHCRPSAARTSTVHRRAVQSASESVMCFVVSDTMGALVYLCNDIWAAHSGIIRISHMLSRKFTGNSISLIKSRPASAKQGHNHALYGK